MIGLRARTEVAQLMIASSRRWRAEVVKRRLELQQAGKKGEELLRVGTPRTTNPHTHYCTTAHTTQPHTPHEIDGLLCLGAFAGWRVLVVHYADVKRGEGLKRLIEAGGGEVCPTSATLPSGLTMAFFNDRPDESSDLVRPLDTTRATHRTHRTHTRYNTTRHSWFRFG